MKEKIMRLITRSWENTVDAYQFYQFLRLSSVIITSSLLVKLGMNQEDVSAFEWVFFIANALSFFWVSGMLEGLLNFFPDLSKSDRDGFIKTLTNTFLVIVTFISSVVFLLHYLQVINLGSETHYILLYLLLNIPATISIHYHILEKAPKKIFFYGIASYLSYTTLICIGFLFYGFTLQGALNGLILWSGLRLLYLLFITQMKTAPLKTEYLIPFFIFSFPLIIRMVVGQGMVLIDGLLVKTFFEERYFAIYRFGARELPINTVLVTSMVIALIPQAVNNLDETLTVIRKRISSLMNFLYPISYVLMFVSPFIYTFLYSPEYIKSAEIFNAYLLIIVTRIMVPQIVIRAHQDNILMMWLSIIEIIINVIFSFILLKTIGIMGIVYATLIAYIAVNLLMIFFAKFRYGRSLEEYLPTKKYYILSGILITCYFLAKYTVF